MIPFETIYKTKRNSWKLYGGWTNSERMEVIYPLSGKDGGTCVADHYYGGADFVGCIIMPDEMVPDKYRVNAAKIVAAMMDWSPDQIDNDYVCHWCESCDYAFKGAPSRTVCRVCDTKSRV